MEKAFIIPKINIITGLLFICTQLSVSSCKKLVEIPPNPTTSISQQAVFTDSTSTMAGIAGVYSGFSFLDGNLSKLLGLSADELTTTLTSDPNTPQFYTNGLTTDNSYVQGFWTSIYSGLYKVNVCLEGTQASAGLSASLKQELSGELKVVRALYYFHLVNMFGGVPLVTVTDYKITDTLPRATTDSVYALILSDLSDATKDLTADYPSPGKLRPNLYTAEALLAKVFLYMGQWQEAFNMADQVIGSNVYQLEPDLNNVFLDGSNEAIWQLPNNSTYIETNEGENYLSPYTNTVPPNYIISSSLIGAFEPNDQRWTDWVNYNTVPVGNSSELLYYPYKYKNLFAPYTTTEDFMILRLADQYLIRAEANARLNHLPAALDDLNQVRQRAGLDASTAVSQNDVLAAILKERQVELFTEWGNRWFDLKRTGTIDAVLGAEKMGWQPSAALFPVPSNEIRSNPKLIQNPGYH